jgi:trimeric autotransporter adhesin
VLLINFLNPFHYYKLYFANMKIIRLAFTVLVFILFSCSNIGAQNIITTVAGGGNIENMLATNRYVIAEKAIVDRFGNIYYWADLKIRKINPTTGIVTTIAGDGQSSFNIYGDGGPALAARFYSIISMAIDYAGNIFIIDYNRVRKINAANGIITTVAGGNFPGSDNEGVPALTANLNSTIDIAVDRFSNIYIVQNSAAKIRKVDANTGIITTVAGTGTWGYNGDNINATSAQLNYPCGVAVDALGNVIVADNGNNRIRKIIKTTGKITTVAGNGLIGFTGDGGLATQASLFLWTGFNASNIKNISVDSAGNIYVADNSRIRKISIVSNIINTVAGNGNTFFSGDGANALSAGMNAKTVTVDSAGNLYIPANNRIRKINYQTNIINTIAGNGTLSYAGEGGLALNAVMSLNYYFPNRFLATDTSRNLFIIDINSNQIRKVDAVTGIISTLAGTGVAGYNGDGINALQAQLNSPYAIIIDRFNNLYIADYGNHRIRKINLATNIISTIAGTGIAGSDGDTGIATAAKITYPSAISLDDSGNIYFADNDFFSTKKVRKITTNGFIYTALQSENTFLSTDRIGNMYFLPADTARISLLKVNTATNITDTIAGGQKGYAGDGGPAKTALFNGIAAIAFDSVGNIFISDKMNNRIRMINASDSFIYTIAGSGIAGYSGDNGIANQAMLNAPQSITLNKDNDLLMADAGNGRIRKVTGITFKTAVCSGQNKTIKTNLTGSNYQWQLNTGNGFTNISDNSIYTGTNSSSLQVNNLNSLWYGYEFRCLTDGNIGYVYTLKFSSIWIGGSGQAWENASNWSCGSVPDSNTDVIVNKATVLLNSNRTIRSLLLGQGANIVVAAGNNLSIIH